MKCGFQLRGRTGLLILHQWMASFFVIIYCTILPKSGHVLTQARHYKYNLDRPTSGSSSRRTSSSTSIKGRAEREERETLVTGEGSTHKDTQCKTPTVQFGESNLPKLSNATLSLTDTSFQGAEWYGLITNRICDANCIQYNHVSNNLCTIELTLKDFYTDGC